MSFRRWLLIALVWHILGLECFGGDPPEGGAESKTTLWEKAKTTVEDPRFTITLATGGVVSLVVLRAANGYGEYHVSQFRLYFTPTSTASSPEELIHTLFEDFESCFTDNPVAKAHVRPVDSTSPVIVEFWCRLWPHRWMKRLDTVRLMTKDEWPTSFAAKTLRVEGKYFKNNFFKKHFLSGVRSWTIVPAEGTNSYYLETAAYERYTNLLYWAANWRNPWRADSKKAMEKQIEKCWVDFLWTAVGKLGSANGDLPSDLPNSIFSLSWTIAEEAHKDSSGTYVFVYKRRMEYPEKTFESSMPPEYVTSLYAIHPAIENELASTPA